MSSWYEHPISRLSHPRAPELRGIQLEPVSISTSVSVRNLQLPTESSKDGATPPTRLLPRDDLYVSATAPWNPSRLTARRDLHLQHTLISPPATHSHIVAPPSEGRVVSANCTAFRCHSTCPPTITLRHFHRSLTDRLRTREMSGVSGRSRAARSTPGRNLGARTRGCVDTKSAHCLCSTVL